MKILVTNDDGIYARGLWALAWELSQVGQVLVVAPDREQSVVGTSVTLHTPIRAREVEPRARIDYVSVADAETLEELERVEGPALVSLAVRIGRTRLIDNILIEP